MKTLVSRRGLLAALVASACALPAPRAPRAADAGTITVYNAQHESLARAWADAFTKETGIRVVLREGKDMEFANQILQEGKASPADVFITENAPAMALVDAAGLFAPLPKETLDLAPPEFRPADGSWIGVAARATVFAYNRKKLKEADLPKSAMDLEDPSWKGRWAAAPAGADFQAIVAAMLQLKGEAATLAWLKAMKAGVVPFRSNSLAMRAVNRGEVDGALIYHYYFFGDQARTGENSNSVDLRYFGHGDPGAFVSLSGAGVLAASKNKPQAQAFVRWLAGPGGQKILREGNSFEYAVGRGEASHPQLVPLDEIDAPKISPDKLDSAKVADLMTRAGLL
ncbi:iron ABC transporter substrate-binding protein [Methylocella sp.]|uniref:iron ABC transporter substrate-binding protein n=1 Tax=Methylocella sp. TaxID=1978226 RepID=UPI003784590C